MFNFFDNQKNPLMYMMNMMNTESTQDAAGTEKEPVDAELMELLKQAFGMQMQMMGMMCTMQMAAGRLSARRRRDPPAAARQAHADGHEPRKPQQAAESAGLSV